MTARISCYDCRFFSPGENGCPSYLHNEELGKFDETNEGICRRQTPRHGKTIKRPDGDEYVCLAEWPKVFTHDWCGEFQTRHSDVDESPQESSNRNADGASTPSAHSGS